LKSGAAHAFAAAGLLDFRPAPRRAERSTSELAPDRILHFFEVDGSILELLA
jgi:hypothetical protein